MRVSVTIERDDDDEIGESTSMGISAGGVEPLQVAKLLMAGAEMILYPIVEQNLSENGATADEVAYGAPLRTRIFTMEILTTQEPTPYHWVRLE